MDHTEFEHARIHRCVCKSEILGYLQLNYDKKYQDLATKHP